MIYPEVQTKRTTGLDNFCPTLFYLRRNSSSLSPVFTCHLPSDKDTVFTSVSVMYDILIFPSSSCRIPGLHLSGGGTVLVPMKTLHGTTRTCGCGGVRGCGHVVRTRGLRGVFLVPEGSVTRDS